MEIHCCGADLHVSKIMYKERNEEKNEELDHTKQEEGEE